MRVWDTRQPLAEDFAAAWHGRLARAPHASFAFDPRVLAWEARHGRHALAALTDEGGLEGALVLRETRGGYVCGWPWRWQAAVADPPAEGPPGLVPEHFAVLHRQACALAGARRLRFHAPCPPPAGVNGFAAGATLLQRVARSDEELLAVMDPTKRRQVRRAREQGYEVVEARSHELFRGFEALQRETATRHGQAVPEQAAGTPEAGEGWREWELPWMWLLVALSGGRVESGIGLALCPGGILEGRTGASTPAALRSGAFVQLVYESARRGRDLGHRWQNVGGDTFFKRDVLGRSAERVAMSCWLGGGRRWSGVNLGEAWLRRARARAARLARRPASGRGREGR